MLRLHLQEQEISYIANRESIDTDGDGIPDMYEVLGMKVTNGQVLYSELNKSDMDGDGLTDKEELNVKKNKKTGEVVAFVCSYPMSKDSDKDGLVDFEDPYPTTPKGVNFSIVNSLSYFPVVKSVRDKIDADVENYIIFRCLA